jgi:hypothetical protein
MTSSSVKGTLDGAMAIRLRKKEFTVPASPGAGAARGASGAVGVSALLSCHCLRFIGHNNVSVICSRKVVNPAWLVPEYVFFPPSGPPRSIRHFWFWYPDNTGSTPWRSFSPSPTFEEIISCPKTSGNFKVEEN